MPTQAKAAVREMMRSLRSSIAEGEAEIRDMKRVLSILEGEELVLIGRMNLLDLSVATYEKYRDTVAGNQDITYLDARKKLTRNVLLAMKRPGGTPTKTLYQYGGLHIIVSHGKITWIGNYRPVDPHHTIDQERKRELNDLLGIADEMEF